MCSYILRAIDTTSAPIHQSMICIAKVSRNWSNWSKCIKSHVWLYIFILFIFINVRPTLPIIKHDIVIFIYHFQVASSVSGCSPTSPRMSASSSRSSPCTTTPTPGPRRRRPRTLTTKKVMMKRRIMTRTIPNPMIPRAKRARLERTLRWWKSLMRTQSDLMYENSLYYIQVYY